VVTKDIAESGVYAGNPARLLRKLPGQGKISQSVADKMALSGSR
jgi:acetyltransferase-like isoleucine patch superfamily enzyme